MSSRSLSLLLVGLSGCRTVTGYRDFYAELQDTGDVSVSLAESGGAISVLPAGSGSQTVTVPVDSYKVTFSREPGRLTYSVSGGSGHAGTRCSRTARA